MQILNVAQCGKCKTVFSCAAAGGFSRKQFPCCRCRGLATAYHERPELPTPIAQRVSAPLPGSILAEHLRSRDRLLTEGITARLRPQFPVVTDAGCPWTSADLRSRLESLAFREQRDTFSRWPRGPVILGFAALYGTWSDAPAQRGGEPWERFCFMPGCFGGGVLRQDIRAVLSHRDELQVGSTARGNLRLFDTDTGLAVALWPPSDSQLARDLLTLIRGGDISQMSIKWRSEEERQVLLAGESAREVLRVGELCEVTLCPLGAQERTLCFVHGDSAEHWYSRDCPLGAQRRGRLLDKITH